MEFDYNILIGRYYGYPICCIKSFSIGGLKNINNKKSIKLFGTGFVPCKECNKMNPEQLITIIKKQRVCSLQFPKSYNINNSNFLEEIKRSKQYSEKEISFLIAALS